eukprot:scaffold18094_cov19-Tisochrysis_lutea.AAC.3
MALTSKASLLGACSGRAQLAGIRPAIPAYVVHKRRVDLKSAQSEDQKTNEEKEAYRREFRCCAAIPSAMSRATTSLLCIALCTGRLDPKLLRQAMALRIHQTRTCGKIPSGKAWVNLERSTSCPHCWSWDWCVEALPLGHITRALIPTSKRECETGRILGTLACAQLLENSMCGGMT